MRADYAEQYRTLWERHWWWRSRETLLLREVRALHARAPRRRILDVGCGDGLFFDRLSAFGAVEGLEDDPSIVTNPRWAGRIRLGALGVDFRPVRDYDLLLMLDVLEHIADDQAALLAAREALRPGGHLLLTVPALPWLWSRHDEANEHHRRYDKRGLRRALIAAGFTVERLRFAFAWTVGPLLARRWLRPALGSSRRLARDTPVAIPPGPLNRALTAVSRADHAVGGVVPWPWGSSLLAVARREPEGGCS